MFVLFNMIFSFVAGLIDGIFSTNLGIDAGGGAKIACSALFYSLAVLIPGLAVAVRSYTTPIALDGGYLSPSSHSSALSFSLYFTYRIVSQAIISTDQIQRPAQ